VPMLKHRHVTEAEGAGMIHDVSSVRTLLECVYQSERACITITLRTLLECVNLR
jgi:hypothetical protein